MGAVPGGTPCICCLTRHSRAGLSHSAAPRLGKHAAGSTGGTRSIGWTMGVAARALEFLGARAVANVQSAV